VRDGGSDDGEGDGGRRSLASLEVQLAAERSRHSALHGAVLEASLRAERAKGNELKRLRLETELERERFATESLRDELQTLSHHGRRDERRDERHSRELSRRSSSREPREERRARREAKRRSKLASERSKNESLAEELRAMRGRSNASSSDGSPLESPRGRDESVLDYDALSPEDHRRCIDSQTRVVEDMEASLRGLRRSLAHRGESRRGDSAYEPAYDAYTSSRRYDEAPFTASPVYRRADDRHADERRQEAPYSSRQPLSMPPSSKDAFSPSMHVGTVCFPVYI